MKLGLGGASSSHSLPLSQTPNPFPLPQRTGVGVTSQKGWEVGEPCPGSRLGVGGRCQKGIDGPLYPHGLARVRGSAGGVPAMQPIWSLSEAPSLTSVPLIIVAGA